MGRDQLVAALLLARALAGAAQCTTFGVPCMWPMVSPNGKNRTQCRTTKNRHVPFCSAIGIQRYWDYCTPCPSNCSKAVKPDASALCPPVDMAGSTEVQTPVVEGTTIGGHTVRMPTRYAFYNHLQCLRDNCADLHSSLEPLHSFGQIIANAIGSSFEWDCGGMLGAGVGVQCSSSVADIINLGDWLHTHLGNLTVGDMCRHHCHCGSCCNSTGPTCPPLPTAPAPTPAPTLAPEQAVGGSSPVHVPGYLVLSVLVAAAAAALSEVA